MLRSISVRAEHEYEVRIGAQLESLLTDSSWLRPRSALFVCNEDSAAVCGQLQLLTSDQGLRNTCVQVPRGESAKTTVVLEQLWRACVDAGLDRDGLVIAVGGGTVTDVAGFAASTWMRGVQWVAVPTTTAGMVDAAIGGKTGINTDAGKNVVGAFHSPIAVLCATTTLATLDRLDFAAGLVEALKCGFIADPEILTLMSAQPVALFDVTSDALLEVIARSVQVKADVVSADFTEQAPANSIGREVLNYGHTFGHALEAASGYTCRHGDAVSVGMVFAAELAEAIGAAPDGFTARHREALTALGVPVGHGYRDFAPLFASMGRDKKSRAGVIRFILLRNVADAFVADDVPSDVIEQAHVRTLADVDVSTEGRIL